MPLPATLANRTARKRYAAKILPLAMAQTDDVDPGELVLVGVPLGDPIPMKVRDILDKALARPGDPPDASERVAFSWAPHDMLRDALVQVALGTAGQHASLAARAERSMGRVAWVLEDGRVELVDVRLDDEEAKTLLVHHRRDRRQRDQQELMGIDVGDRPDRSFKPGTALDPNVYLPDPLPEEWIRESELTVEPQSLLVGETLRAKVGMLPLDGRTYVGVMVQCVAEDRLPTDDEVELVTSRLRNVGDFRAMELAEREVELLGGHRVVAAPSELLPDRHH